MLSLAITRLVSPAVLAASLAASFAIAVVVVPTGPLAPTRLELQLGSPQAGATVAPGANVQWHVFARLQAGEHAGLALFAVDLVQDAGNPWRFDLPAGERAPAAMAEFDRPAGFTNPSDDPWGSGYGGTPIGVVGARDLVQIGGAQNVFGVAPACFGPNDDVCMGQGVSVRQGVVTGPVFRTVASGSFDAPSLPGTYTLRLANGLANVLDDVQAAPLPSTTRAVPVTYASDAAFSFTVQ